MTSRLSLFLTSFGLLVAACSSDEDKGPAPGLAMDGGVPADGGDVADGSGEGTEDGPTEGTLTVSVSYAADRPIVDAEVAVFVGATCAVVREEIPAAHAAKRMPLARDAAFEGLPVDETLSVAALGIDEHDQVAAEGCVDARLESGEGRAEVVLEDLPVSVAGAYDHREVLDVATGTGAVGRILGVLRGLSEDPATYLVDRVRTDPGTPGWLRDALGFGPTREEVIGIIQSGLEGVTLPGALVAVGEVGAELDRGLRGLTLRSVLTLRERDEFESVPALRQVTHYELPLEAGTVEREVDTRARFVATFEDGTLTFPEHSLLLFLDDIVETLVYETLLPRVPGEPENFDALVGSLFDCTRDGSGLGPRAAETACELGVGLLATELRDQLRSMGRQDELRLAGVASFVDQDADYHPDAIVDGASEGVWVVRRTGDQALPVTGTYGASRRVEGATEHPLRERMREALE